MALGFNIQTEQSPRYIRPDRSLRGVIVQRTLKEDLGTIWEQRYTDGINSIEEEYSVTFDNRDKEEGLAIAEFLDAKAGVSSFVFTVRDTNLPSGEREVPVVCEDYTLTYVNAETISISAKFIKTVSSTLEFQANPIIPAPTYVLSSDFQTASEGQTVRIELKTSGVANNTEVPYTITGVSTSDINIPLTGVFTVIDSFATLDILVLSDAEIETDETLSLSLDNGKASISIILDEVAPSPPTISANIQTSSPQFEELIYRADGTVLVRNSTFLGEDSVYPASGLPLYNWIDTASDFDFTDFQIKVTEISVDPSVSVVVEPSTALTSYIDFPLDGVRIYRSSSLLTGEGPLSASHSVSVREKSNFLNSAEGSVDVTFLGLEAPPAAVYTLELDPNSSLVEGTAAVFNFTNNLNDGFHTFTVSYTGASSNDIIILNQGFYVENGSGSFVIYLFPDGVSETNETFIISVYYNNSLRINKSFEIIDAVDPDTTAPDKDPATPDWNNTTNAEK